MPFRVNFIVSPSLSTKESESFIGVISKIYDDFVENWYLYNFGPSNPRAQFIFSLFRV